MKDRGIQYERNTNRHLRCYPKLNGDIEGILKDATLEYNGPAEFDEISTSDIVLFVKKKSCLGTAPR